MRITRTSSAYLPYRTAMLCLLLLTLLTLSACAKKQNTPHTAQNGISSVSANTDLAYPFAITVTTGFLYDMLYNIAKDRAEIYQIIGTGIDPHSYTPTRSDIVSVYYADLLFYTGLHLEGGLYTVFNRIQNTRPLYAIADLLEEDILLHDGNVEDPHIWMDPTIWSEGAKKVGTLLAKFDPPHADFYLANAQAYAEQIRALHREIQKMFNTIPKQQRVLITSHDAFGYFGRAYDFEVYGVQGLTTVAESSLKHIANLIAIILENNVSAIFVESSVSPKYINAIIEGAQSQNHRLEKGATLFADSMGAKGSYEGSYIGMIEYNARAITQALGGDDSGFHSFRSQSAHKK